MSDVPFTVGRGVGATCDRAGSPALSASVLRFGSGSENVLLCFKVEGGGGSMEGGFGLAFVCDSDTSVRLLPGEGILLGGRIPVGRAYCRYEVSQSASQSINIARSESHATYRILGVVHDNVARATVQMCRHMQRLNKDAKYFYRWRRFGNVVSEDALQSRWEE